MTACTPAPLIVGITGATGIYAARLLLERAPWPVDLVVSRWGRQVAEMEVGDLAAMEALARRSYAADDLSAPISSGSVPTRGMVILPCSAHTLAQIAAGLADSLIPRAAHCHLKERRPLIVCLREAPLTGIDLANARRVERAGGVIMPLSPPTFMFAGKDPHQVSLHMLMEAYVERVLALLGQPATRNWEDVR